MTKLDRISSIVEWVFALILFLLGAVPTLLLLVYMALVAFGF